MAEVYGGAAFAHSVPLVFFLPVQQIFIGPYCKPSLGMNFLFVLDEGSKYTEVNNI